MTFTDDDLKQLKARALEEGDGYISFQELHALLARLEASESCAMKLKVFDLGELREGNKVQWTYTMDLYNAMRDCLKAWRKACGRVGE